MSKERSYITLDWKKALAFCVVMTAAVLAWGNRASAEADEGIPETCYNCHIELKESLSHAYVHFPFEQGQCDSCHDPHISNLKGLLKEEIDSLCLSCHRGIENVLKGGKVHGAIETGNCTDCHYAHSARNKYLLVASEKELCWECHETLKGQLDEPVVHVPFRGGECSSCHNAHASPEENQLVAKPDEMCQQCHAPRCRAGGVAISAITRDMDCTECHSGHSSSAGSLLGPYGHEAFLDKACQSCHNTFTPDGEITTREKGTDLCFDCHEMDPAMAGEGDVHGQARDVSCTLCHSHHASEKENLTVKESEVCLECHQSTGSSIAFMEKTWSIKCIPVKERQCFGCHKPLHSQEPYYFMADIITTCSECHKAQHEISHPLGEGVLDPRSGETITCISCHSMHSAKADFMLQFDRNRALCIQCHKK